MKHRGNVFAWNLVVVWNGMRGRGVGSSTGSYLLLFAL